MESQIAGQSAVVMDLDDVEQFWVGMLVQKFSPATATATLLRLRGTSGTVNPDVHLGKALMLHGGAPSEFIDHQAGKLEWGHLEMIGTPSTANGGTGKYVKLPASLPLGRSGLDREGYKSRVRVSDWTKLVADLRAYGTVEPPGSRNVSCLFMPRPGGTADWTAITGTDVAGVALSGAADEVINFRAPAPAGSDGFGTGLTVRVRLTIPTQAGVTGNQTAKLVLALHKVQAGVAVTAGTNGSNATTVVPAVNAVREMYLSTGAVAVRGDELIGSITRPAASDAADDYTGSVVVLGVDVITDK
jgi:hypothetical protein